MVYNFFYQTDGILAIVFIEQANRLGQLIGATRVDTPRYVLSS